MCSAITQPSPSSHTLHPFSSVQREIWFDQALLPDTPVYNLTAQQSIPGLLDRAIFEQAIALLVQETDILRMVVTERDGEPFQSFPEMSQVRPDFLDCSAEAEPLQAALGHIAQEVNRPFRIFEEPLFRFTLIKLSATSHIWLQVYHHLLVDGAAMALVAQRCGAIYSALLRGEPVPARPGLQYLDFIRSDAGYLSSDSFEHQGQYWRTKYTSLPEPLFAPKPAFAGRTEPILGSNHVWSLPRAKFAQLEVLAQANSATAFHALLGLFYVVFSRTHDRDECVIGLPVLNRNTQAFKRTIGLFSSMIPARFSHGREVGFVGLMQAIAKTLREGYRSQRFPLSEINRLAGVFKAGRKRLFDLSLSFIKNDFSSDFGTDNTSHVALINNSAEQLPLAIYVCEYSEAQDIQFHFSYNLAYFDEEEIRLVQERFLHLIDEVLKHPELSIGKLDILLPGERNKLLNIWSRSPEQRGASDSFLAAEEPMRQSPASLLLRQDKGPHRRRAQQGQEDREACVHELFEAQVLRDPDAIALIFEDEILTYAELNARANLLAQVLIAKGIAPDDRVAIALERSTAMIVAFLATLKAGGAAVPLDPAYPAKRLLYMLENSEAKVLLTVEALGQKFAGCAGNICCLDTEKTPISAQAVGNPTVGIRPRNLAYVIYTSGSTGEPKGVAVEHQSISLHSEIVKAFYELRTGDRNLLFASFSFDTSIEEILATLCSGAALVVVSPGLPTPEYIDAIVRRHGVTVLNFPPPFFRLWAEYCGAGIPPSLRLIILGGDVLTPELTAARANWPKPWPRLLNAYGPTECTITTTCYEVPESLSGSSVPIGRPLSHRTHYILDSLAQPTPLGIPGELHIGGDCLARGYLNQPKLSAVKFIADPFSRAPGARLYRTGDLVRYLPDGNIEFLGRLDHQVKIRGFRIELGEIEAALVTHPSLREAVVISRGAENGDPRLLAYLVAAVGEDVHSPDLSAHTLPSTGELRAFLRTRLPDFMVPAAFVFLPAIPLTPNGKVDRKALPLPEPSALDQVSMAQGDALEEIISGLWSTLLHHPSPGLSDNFFELGGHSLIATQLSSRMHQALGLTVPVRWIFDAPTISELAALIRPLLADGKIVESCIATPANLILPGTSRITPDLLPLIVLTQSEIDHVVSTVEGGTSNVQDIYPVAPLQGGILFHCLLQPSGNLYLGLALLVFESQKRSQDFVTALQTVIDRHDILRTALCWAGLPTPVQVVWRQATLSVQTKRFDPTEGPIAEQVLEYGRTLQTQFDLTKAPLLSLVLAQDGERSLLLLIAHHLIMDHATLEIMLEEVAAIVQGTPQNLPPAVPFRDFVAETLRGGSAASHEAFFSDMLGDIEKPTTPFDLLDTHGLASVTNVAKDSLSPAMSTRLRTQMRKQGATPAAAFHLAWALVLSHLCKQDDVVFGTVLMGRMQGGKEMERAVGLFLNTLPIRISCGTASVSEGLRATQQRLLALIHHEHASLGMAQRCSKVSGNTPLFSSILNYRPRFSLENDIPRKLGFELVHSEDRNNFPLCLSIDDLETAFRMIVEVDVSVDSGRLCALMRATVEAMVEALENAPHTRLGDLDKLSPGEKHLLLKGMQTAASSQQQEYSDRPPGADCKSGTQKRRQIGRL